MFFLCFLKAISLIQHMILVNMTNLVDRPMRMDGTHLGTTWICQHATAMVNYL